MALNREERVERLKTFLFSVITIVAFFGLMELICRSFNLTEHFDADFKFYIRHIDNDIESEFNVEDALLMWSPKPGYDDGTIRISSEGFRDKEYGFKKPEGVFRILCLGDSSTFDKTYTSLLEDMLNRDFAIEDRRFEVINAGVTGYTSYQGLWMYRDKGRRYKPDVVTFYFGVNDPVKRFHLTDRQIMQEGVPVFIKVIKNRFLLKSHFYRLLRKLIQTLMGRDSSEKGERLKRVSPGDYRQNIIELYKLSKRDNFKLILISPPLCKEAAQGWEKGEDIIRYRRVLEDVSREYDIPLLEIKEMTEKSEPPTRGYFNDAIHPNDSGHRMIARALYDYLKRFI